MTDPIVQRNRGVPKSAWPVARRAAEPRLHLIPCGHRHTRRQITACRPERRVEVLYWSLWKEALTRAGPLKHASVDRALEFIAAEDTFWAAL